MGVVTARNEEPMTWKYRGKLIYPSAGEPVYSGTSIGRKLSPEYQQVVDRIRVYQLQRLEERRKRDR